MAGVQQDDDDVISAINVTPLVDVTLVLLIIFMVTATYIVANSIPVDLPEAATGEEISTTFVVNIDSKGVLFLDGQSTTDERLLAKLRKAYQQDNDIRAIISADKRVVHEKFVRAVDLVRKAGISKFAIDIKRSIDPSQIEDQDGGENQ